MSEQDKRAEEVWKQLQVLKMADAHIPDERTLAMGIIAAALAQARREGYLSGKAAVREMEDGRE